LSPSMAIMAALSSPQDEVAWPWEQVQGPQLAPLGAASYPAPLPMRNRRRRGVERSFDWGNNTRVAELGYIELLLDHARVGVNVEHRLNASEIGRGARLSRKIV